MNRLFIFCVWCFTFSPIIIIYGSDSEYSDASSASDGNSDDGDPFKELKIKLNQMAANGENISGVLLLSPGGYLGEGGYGLAYKGVRISDSRPVAIKFIDQSNKHSAQREYSIYSYLHAVDNATVERFGIPAIYYYGQWGADYTVMALTLCDGNLFDNGYGYDWEFPVNNLIVFRQFVRQSKYIHSCGIRHDDIKPENLMIKNHQCFLIDYNLGSVMNEDTELCTYRYKPRRCHQEIKRLPIDDWESFLYSMLDLYGVPLKWFSSIYDELDAWNLNRICGEAKKDVRDIIKKIKAIESVPMRNVFLALAYQIFKDAKEYPDYEKLDRYITAQINSVLEPNQSHEYVYFTWLEQDEIEEALNNPIPNIQEIRDPRQFNFNYPAVDYDHFNRTTGSGSSR